MKDKRVYVFDWDDNIIHMPTVINMDYYNNTEWLPITLSTREYAKIKGNKQYRFPIGVVDPFLNFSNNENFIIDLEKALIDKNFGPSFKKFKECLMYGNDFAIITARGQSKDVILGGIVMLIGSTFYANEMNMMLSNVGNVAAYLQRQKIYPVTSSEMEYGDIPEEQIEIRKVLSLSEYIDSKVSGNTEFEFDGKFSIGISDDDKKNINTIKDFINKALKPKYPELHFVVYDTSNPDEIIKRPI